MKKNVGVLLLNIGSPKSTSLYHVAKYLFKFLMDPRVIDINVILRFILLSCIIIPFRTKKTRRAYKKIWDKASPLYSLSIQLVDEMQKQLGPSFVIKVGMTYGDPSIKDAINELTVKTNSLLILPLFPQYSSAATGACLEKSLSIIDKKLKIPNIKVINNFHNNKYYINSCISHIKNHLKVDNNFDYLIFSYHGLPFYQLKKAHKCLDKCNTSSPCVNNSDYLCYRFQCFETSRLISEKLGIPKSKIITSFQSRLGSTPWIQPYTDKIIQGLHKKGVKKIAIFSPSFVTDCLETLEEINMQLRDDWEISNSHSFQYIPCLNLSSYWVKNICKIISEEYVEH